MLILIRSHFQVTKTQSHLLFNCLTSLKAQLPSESEVLIVDNNSTDSTKKFLKKIIGAKVISNKENVHFLRAANTAASQAAGKYLLFLNSDIELLSSAVSEALSLAEENSDYGVVGGMLVGLDGRIQELGGLIFRDGTTSPLFQEEKVETTTIQSISSVDYCSGAFLLTPRALFAELGGFQSVYEPAYYEDVDYCLRVKMTEHKVICSTTIKAIHVRRASALDPKEPDTLIRKNHKKFFALNTSTLLNEPFLNYPINPSLNLTSGILIFDDFLPIASRGQGLPRSAQIFSILKEREIPTAYILSHPTESAFFSDYKEESPLILPSEDSLFRFLSHATSLPATWWVSRPTNLERVSKVLAKMPELRSKVKIIYDSEALYSTRLVLEHEIRNDVALSEEDIISIVSKEMDIVRVADHVIAVNQIEATTFKDFGIQNVSIASYGIKKNKSDILQDFHETNGLFCVNPCSDVTSPNADAAIITAKVIYPRVLKLLTPLIPRLHFAGDICRDVQEQLSDPNILLLGLVDQLKEVAQQHRVFIAPHRFGAGIPIKVIEAAHFGIPIVCSELIALQLGWRDNHEVLVGRTSEEISAKVAALYVNPELWRTLQKNAYTSVVKQFNYDQFKSSIISLVK